jgi:hypothetical protein
MMLVMAVSEAAGLSNPEPAVTLALLPEDVLSRPSCNGQELIMQCFQGSSWGTLGKPSNLFYGLREKIFTILKKSTNFFGKKKKKKYNNKY